MLKTIIESTDLEELKEVQKAAYDAGKDATGFEQENGVLVNPIIEKNEENDKYSFDIVVGPENEMDYSITVDVNDINELQKEDEE